MEQTEKISNVIPMKLPIHLVEATSIGDQQFFFERLIRYTPDMIYSVDIDGVIRFVNERSTSLTGFSKSELIGRHYLDLVSRKHRDHVQNFYIDQIIEETDVTYMEFPIITKSGEEKWVGQNTVFIIDTNEPGFQACARDISEKHAVEVELRNIKKQYQNMFEHAVQGMLHCTAGGVIIAVNLAFLNLLGYRSEAEVKKLNPEALYLFPRDLANVHAVLEGHGRCYNVELHLKKNDGTILTVLEHSRVIKDADGSEAMYEHIYEDITAKRALADV